MHKSTVIASLLLVALLVGLQYAKGLAAGLGVPLIGVNHVLAHLHAVQLSRSVAYPYLGLVVSGGHTHLFRVAGPAAITLIGHTARSALTSRSAKPFTVTYRSLLRTSPRERPNIAAPITRPKR